MSGNSGASESWKKWLKRCAVPTSAITATSWRPDSGLTAGAPLVQRGPGGGPRLERLEGGGGAEDVGLAVPAAHDLEPHRQPRPGEAARYVGRGLTGQVEGIHERDPVEDRVGRLAPEVGQPLEGARVGRPGGHGHLGRQQEIVALEGGA